jgi:hypothetical protein
MTLTATDPHIELIKTMYDLAKTIQEDRRHQADMYRVVSSLPKERSLSVGRYRLTVSKRPVSAQPAVLSFGECR